MKGKRYSLEHKYKHKIKLSKPFSAGHYQTDKPLPQQALPQQKLPQKMLIQPDTPTNTHLTNVRPRFLLQRNKRSPSISSPAKQTFMLNLFSNLTNVRPRFLLQLNKCSPSASSPNKHSSSLSSATKQTFVLDLFPNQAKFEAKVRKVSET